MKELVSSERAYREAYSEFQSVAATAMARGGKLLEGGRTMQFPTADEAPAHLYQYSAKPALKLPTQWEVQSDGAVDMSDGKHLILVLDVLGSEPQVMRSAENPFALTRTIESVPLAIEALTIVTQGLRNNSLIEPKTD